MTKISYAAILESVKMTKCIVKNGSIHIAFILLILAALAIGFSVSISARHSLKGRALENTFLQTFCQQNPASLVCKNQASSNRNLRSMPAATPPSFIPSRSGPCPPMGDATGDGVLNDFDAQAILNHIAGVKPIILRFQTQSDVNTDGAITALDAQQIRQYLASTLPIFKACK